MAGDSDVADLASLIRLHRVLLEKWVSAPVESWQALEQNWRAEKIDAEISRQGEIAVVAFDPNLASSSSMQGPH
jgi:hypothetical protein